MYNIENRKIGEIVTFKRGYDLSTNERLNGSFPVISSGGVSGYHSEYKKEGESIIIGRYGTLGEVYYVNEKYWPHNTTLYAIDFHDNVPKYVFYLMKCLGNLKTSDKSAVPGINRNDLHELTVPYIKNKNQQTKISSILSAFDDKIEFNNKINAELEAMAKTLYDYWFVQFDFPDENSKPYKSSGGSMVYNAELKREIPEGWEKKTFGNYVPSKGGFAFKSTCWQKEGIPVIKIKDIQENYTLSISDFSFVDADISLLARKFIAKPGDIVIAMTGATVGKYAIVPYSDKAMLVNQRVGLFQLGEEGIFKLPFLINSLNQKYFRENVFTIASGAAQPNISNEQINDILLVLPHKELVSTYNKSLQSAYQIILNNQYQNQTLAALRDWLLPMLMNGQVTINEAYKTAEETVNVSAEPNSEYKTSVKNLSIPDKSKGFAKQVLAGKIVLLFIEDKHFTRIKFQKLQFLAEHIAEADLNLNYYFQAAGPYDNRFMHTISDSFRKLKWFNEQRYQFILLSNYDKIEDYYTGYFKPVENSLSKLFTLLLTATEGEAEIIATIYAVWNNRIIKKEPVTNKWLTEDFYNWSDRKRRYSEDEILKGIQWLQENEFEPNGFGKEIKRAKK